MKTVIVNYCWKTSPLHPVTISNKFLSLNHTIKSFIRHPDRRPLKLDFDFFWVFESPPTALPQHFCLLTNWLNSRYQCCRIRIRPIVLKKFNKMKWHWEKKKIPFCEWTQRIAFFKTLLFKALLIFYNSEWPSPKSAFSAFFNRFGSLRYWIFR